jgi:hypothetical protein
MPRQALAAIDAGQKLEAVAAVRKLADALLVATFALLS